MKIRSLITSCEALDLVDKETVKMIRRLGETRHEFVHSKIHRITKKMEEKISMEDEKLRQEWESHDSIFHEMTIAGTTGRGVNRKRSWRFLEETVKALSWKASGTKIS